MSTPSMSSDVWGKSFAPHAAAADARRAWNAARAALQGSQSRWTKRLVILQSAIAVAMFFVWFTTHPFWVSVIYAGVLWALLWPMHWLVPRLTRGAGEAVANAERQVVEAEAAEAERFMAAANLGTYEWIAEEDVVLGVFPERGYLYYYGPRSNYEHLVLRADAVRQVILTDATSSVQESMQDTHTDENVPTAATPHVRIERKGMFPMATTLRPDASHCYMLEIEYRAPDSAESRWLDVPFCCERADAESWRAMILRAGSAVTA